VSLVYSLFCFSIINSILLMGTGGIQARYVFVAVLVIYISAVVY